jgi:hypothetical protein
MAQSLRISEKYLKSLRILKQKSTITGYIVSKVSQNAPIKHDFARDNKRGLISRVGVLH